MLNPEKKSDAKKRLTFSTSVKSEAFRRLIEEHQDVPPDIAIGVLLEHETEDVEGMRRFGFPQGKEGGGAFHGDEAVQGAHRDRLHGQPRRRKEGVSKVHAALEPARVHERDEQPEERAVAPLLQGFDGIGPILLVGGAERGREELVARQAPADGEEFEDEIDDRGLDVAIEAEEQVQTLRPVLDASRTT